MVGKEYALNMVILVLNDSRPDIRIALRMLHEVLIIIFYQYGFLSLYIFPHIGYRETTFIKLPLLTAFFKDFSIDEDFLKGFKLISNLCIILILCKRRSIYYKQADVQTYLLLTLIEED